MTNFFQQVYALVARIPEGKVCTYGTIAAALGNPRGARTVGWALRSTPATMDLPTHRVVNRAGTLAPGEAFGGREIQRLVLEGEGITFRSDGRIDLGQHLWEPEDDGACMELREG